MFTQSAIMSGDCWFLHCWIFTKPPNQSLPQHKHYLAYYICVYALDKAAGKKLLAHHVNDRDLLHRYSTCMYTILTLGLKRSCVIHRANLPDRERSVCCNNDSISRGVRVVKLSTLTSISAIIVGYNCL